MLHRLLVHTVAIVLLNTSSITAMEAVRNVDKIYFTKKNVNQLVSELLITNKSLINNQNYT